MFVTPTTTYCSWLYSVNHGIPVASHMVYLISEDVLFSYPNSTTNLVSFLSISWRSNLFRKYLLEFVSRYRCPRCNSFNSVNVNRIFDGRLLFSCSKCNICALVPKDTDTDAPDSGYLEFLDLYDNGRIVKNDDLNAIMQQERILRPSSEIKRLLEKSNEGTTDKLLKEVLSSQEDYVVEYRLIQDSDSILGSPVSELPLDDRIISVLSRKGIKHVYGFQQESINRILLGMDAIIVAPTASGKTEAFCIPILQRISKGSNSSYLLTNQTTTTRTQVSASSCTLLKRSQEINFQK